VLGDVPQLQQRHQCRGATADAVEQRHELRHLRHLHPLGAGHADHGADRDGHQDRHHVVQVALEEHHDGRDEGTQGPDWLPRRAVRGELSPLRARMKQTAATR
jgi:hypothetical protein